MLVRSRVMVRTYFHPHTQKLASCWLSLQPLQPISEKFALTRCEARSHAGSSSTLLLRDSVLLLLLLTRGGGRGACATRSGSRSRRPMSSRR
jgi:hypothetical protein